MINSRTKQKLVIYFGISFVIIASAAAKRINLPKYGTSVNNSFSIRLLSSFPTSSPVTGIGVDNNYVYINTTNNGVYVINIADSLNPIETGHCDLPGLGGVLKLRNNYLYTVNWDAGLRIVDISNPSSPREVGYIDTDGHSQDLFINDTLVFIADRENGVVVVDVSNPENPTILSHYSTFSWTRGLAIYNNIGYVGLSNRTLSVLDVSILDSIYEISNIELPGEPRGISVVNNLLFAACRNGGLAILDISNTNNIHQIAIYNDGTYVMWSIEELPYIYILSRNSLKVLTMQDTTFTQIGSITFDQSAYAFYKRNNLLFIGLNSGLYIYELSGIGIKEELSFANKQNAVLFYSKNMLKISFDTLINKNIYFEIYKINGRIIFRKILSGGEDCIYYRFPNAGIFIARWKYDGQSNWRYKKFIVIN